MSACEIAEVILFDRMLNQSEQVQMEGYLAHKWNLQDDILPDSHPHLEQSPFGGITTVNTFETKGGDPPS